MLVQVYFFSSIFVLQSTFDRIINDFVVRESSQDFF